MTTSALAGALVLFVLATSAETLGIPSPLAISHGTGTVCGVLAGPSLPHAVQCVGANSRRVFSLRPNVSFVSVSGSRDFLCGLRSGGGSFFCWNAPGNLSASGVAVIPTKRVYNSETAPLEELAVGEDHVFGSSGTELRWWRGGRRFPVDAVDGKFLSLTSGNGFSCAILANSSRVRCWGSQVAEDIESGFANESMSTIVAGGSHACGITLHGLLTCRGRNGSGQLDSPPDASPFGFSKLAMGESHSCAIRQQNDTVVCWGGADAGGAGGGAYEPVKEPLQWIVAGGNLTCGVVSLNLSVICWSRSSPSVALPLPRILPGVCTEQSSCGCGTLADSQVLCSGAGVICKPCDGNRSAQPPSPPPPPSTPPAVPRRRASKGLLAFAIVGAVGCFAGVCSILYCLWTGVCRQKKVHNSVQPTITGAGNSNGVTTTALPRAPFSSPTKSRSRSRSLIFGRQGSRVMSRQRSGPSSAKFTDRAEEFSFGELAAATKNFSLETRIGAGSFGTVYRGKLADGREVAIKRGESGPLAKKFQEKESAFQSELAFLSRLHHKHLVGLVGYCEDRDERLLVYEYMKNGALYDHLHSPRHASGNNGVVLNSWRMRIKILLDASRGIEYLHNYAVPPIIHRDIKSSNILLDGNWTAKVSDFGLSLSGPDGEGGYLAMKAAGTVGYMDPEYYGLRHLTVKSDVYGLGVVMLEVLTGRRAIFKGDDGEPVSVVDYAVPRIVEGEVEKVLDTRAGTPEPSEAEAVERVANTAVHCVSLEGRERPFMTDIVANLEHALALCDDSRGSVSSAGNSITSYD